MVYDRHEPRAVCAFVTRENIGCDRALVTPQDPEFEGGKTHASSMYGGVSLPALVRFARSKEYTLLGSKPFLSGMIFSDFFAR
jgi:hypothetical protein